MRAQDLNIPKDTISNMDNYSSIYESDMRDRTRDWLYNSSYAKFHGATEVFSKVAKNGLYIVSVVHSDLPNLEAEESVFRQLDMGDDISILVDGIEVAKKIAEVIHEKTGKPAGIAKYDGVAGLARLHTQTAIRRAEHNSEKMHVYDKDEEEDFHRKLIEKFSEKDKPRESP